MSQERPRVLVYRKYLLPFSETFVLQQASALTRYEPVLTGLRREDGLDLSAMRVEVVRGAGGGLREELQLRGGRPPAAFVSRLRALDPRVIHAHFGQDALQAARLKERLGVPLVVTLHGYDVTKTASLRNGPVHLAYRLRLPSLARRADLVIAVSDHVRRCAVQAGFSPEQLVTHYIGVQTGAFTPSPLEAREPFVLAVGRFVEKKGFVHLLEAMRRVQDARPGVPLRIVGRGPLEEPLRARAAELGVAVEFLGAQPSTEVARLMGAARVVAVPSVTAATGDTEGLPITLLEAMATGTPVVATRHAGIPEAVRDGETGVLVAERDVEGLAAGLERLLADDEAWRRMGAAARARVEQDFDLDRQSRALEDLYDRARGLGTSAG